jgi:hypothetical protein
MGRRFCCERYPNPRPTAGFMNRKIDRQPNDIKKANSDSRYPMRTGAAAVHMEGPAMSEPKLDAYAEKLLILYYADQVSSSWVAHRLGFEGRPALWDWMRARGLPIMLGASGKEIIQLRVELWAEGNSTAVLDGLMDPDSYPALARLQRSEAEVRAICEELGVEYHPDLDS